MSRHTCSDCGDQYWTWEGHSKCKQLWYVYWADEIAKLDLTSDDSEDDPAEDAFSIRADDSEAAVERWATEHDQDGEYTIVNGSPQNMLVWKPNQFDKAKRLCVSGELVPEYRVDGF